MESKKIEQTSEYNKNQADPRVQRASWWSLVGREGGVTRVRGWVVQTTEDEMGYMDVLYTDSIANIL